MFLLDTNILIYFFKGIGKVEQNLMSKAPKDIGMPAIVLFEIEVGIGKSKSPHKRIKQLNDLISVISVLPFGMKEARSAAQIRVQLEKKGIPIGPLDILIGGTALAHQATLVTHNIKEFGRIKKLQLEDWY
jgi:tRNA(fMet)-specific endonuclease VapC